MLVVADRDDVFKYVIRVCHYIFSGVDSLFSLSKRYIRRNIAGCKLGGISVYRKDVGNRKVLKNGVSNVFNRNCISYGVSDLCRFLVRGLYYRPCGIIADFRDNFVGLGFRIVGGSYDILKYAVRILYGVLSRKRHFLFYGKIKCNGKRHFEIKHRFSSVHREYIVYYNAFKIYVSGILYDDGIYGFIAYGKIAVFNGLLYRPIRIRDEHIVEFDYERAVAEDHGFIHLNRFSVVYKLVECRIVFVVGNCSDKPGIICKRIRSSACIVFCKRFGFCFSVFYQIVFNGECGIRICSEASGKQYVIIRHRELTGFD